jgi:hypothetical protein
MHEGNAISGRNHVPKDLSCYVSHQSEAGCADGLITFSNCLDTLKSFFLSERPLT